MSSLARWKQLSRSSWPDLPEDEKLRLKTARTQEDIKTVMTWILSQGTLIHFKVKTLFQQKEDSDSDDDSDQKG